MSAVPYAYYTAEGTELGNGLDEITVRAAAQAWADERGEPSDVYQGSRHVTTCYPDIDACVRVELDSPVGPRVSVVGDWEQDEVEAALPEGWTIGDNWANGVRAAGRARLYPLVRS